LTPASAICGPPVQGGFASGFEDVARAFETNFLRHGEVGAAFAVYCGRDLIVDLWGGLAHRETGRPWQQDTLQLIFSGTKGLCAVCVLALVERGLINLRDPVAAYWPEFGKTEILIADVMSHTSRLPGIETPLSVYDLTADRKIAALLAAQHPSDDPRAAYCYHPLTYGWLCGELIRRVDGRSIGRFFREEVAIPLDLELWIGLPEEYELRVSNLELASDWGTSPFLNPAVQAADPLTRSIWGNPPFFAADVFPWNERAFHRMEIPAVNGIGTARSMAHLYAALVGANASSPLSAETVQLARHTLSDGFDQVHGIRAHWGVGFELQTELMAYGPPPDAFGVGGAGGSVHGAWPSHGVGFSYAMNLMRDDQEVDPRADALLTSLDRCLQHADPTKVRANRT
jgi:CubicO group peptidase (beta-lactamase class C family)